MTRGIRRSFEPAVVMIFIYGTPDIGVKSQADEAKTGLEITEPSSAEQLCAQVMETTGAYLD